MFVFLLFTPNWQVFGFWDAFVDRAAGVTQRSIGRGTYYEKVGYEVLTLNQELNVGFWEVFFLEKWSLSYPIFFQMKI